MKRCRDCGETKLLSKFPRNSYRPDGYDGNCKPCHNLSRAQWKAGRSRMEERRTPEAVRERFYAHTEPVEGSDCLRWIGSFDMTGYGRFPYPPGHTVAAHRMAYFIETGNWIPSELYGCHSCDNRWCVQWTHISPGTQKANMDDMRVKGRAAIGDKHPMHLHPELRVRGERHGRSKLTEEQAQSILDLWAQGGWTHRSLGEKFGVHRATVSYIVNRVTWTHLSASET